MLDKLQNVRAGGSTILSGGIEYCKKYLNDYSSFFIVSDFQDDLEEWIKHAKNIKAKKTAVAYANIANKISFSHWFSMIGSNSNSHRAVTGIKEFSAVFDTVLIRSGSP
jgi:guanylate kinase